MGQGDDRGSAVGAQRFESLIGPIVGQGDAGKAPVHGERASGIDDGHRITGQRRHRRQRLGNVNRADDHEAFRGGEDMDEEFAVIGDDGGALVLGQRFPHAVEHRVRQV